MIKAGLEGVIAAETRLSSVNGDIGELIIGGFPLAEIAGKVTFEEMVYLLWYDTLPTEKQLQTLQTKLQEQRNLTETTLELLKDAAQRKIPVMDALRMGASTLSLADTGYEPNPESDAIRLIAAFPTIVAAYWRYLDQQDPIPPNPDLGHAANYLYMITGQIPSEAQTRALETYLNTVVDHGFNASTFTARVIISTQSDMVSAIVGAVGALKGPLHGGAPGPTLDMVFAIAKPENAESYIRAELAAGKRIMGFGHRVYKVLDPRAVVLANAAEKLMEGDEGFRDLYTLVKYVEETAIRLLEEHKPGRNLKTNVEFYTALLLHGLGLETALFAPTFAVSRVGGWTAHCFEQIEQNRLIRPKAAYIGEKTRTWLAVSER